MNEQRLIVLLDRYFDGALSEADRQELERELLSSPQSRDLYWSYARLHTDAVRWGRENWGRQIARQAQRMRHRMWVRWGVAAVLLLAACIAMWNGTKKRPDVARNDPATSPAGVAVIASSVNARWGEGTGPVGAILTPGRRVTLEAGAAQIDFYSGARLLMRGPAALQIVSENEALCSVGSFTAQVPAPARGFTLRTASLSAVDMGTEFGMSVPASGAVEVHVFAGRVEVRPASSSSITLQANEAGQFTATATTKLPAAPKQFLRQDEYSSLAEGETQRRIAQWQRAVDGLSKDQQVLAHYLFRQENFADRTVPNLAVSGWAGSAATIVGCTIADGRWPGWRASELRGAGDRLRIDVPGTFKAITLIAWMRFDQLPNSQHALLAPDGLEEGTVRWSLTDAGEMRLGIARSSGKAEPNWEVIMSPPVITNQRFGKWVMLASTFDGKRIHHYVDGKLVKSGDAFSPAPLRIGLAEIGNWRGTHARFVVGRIDEFAILARAMTEEEIEAFYSAGRPLDSTLH